MYQLNEPVIIEYRGPNEVIYERNRIIDNTSWYYSVSGRMLIFNKDTNYATNNHPDWTVRLLPITYEYRITAIDSLKTFALEIDHSPEDLDTILRTIELLKIKA